MQGNEFPLSSLIKIQYLLSSQSPTHLEMTTRGERHVRARKRGRAEAGEQQEWQRTTERSPATLTAKVHFNTSSTTPQTHPPPSPLTVTIAALCFPAQPQGGPA